MLVLPLLAGLMAVVRAGSATSFNPVPHPRQCLTQTSFSFPQFNVNKTGSLRKLRYADGSLHDVLLPYAGWASARILAEIFYILLAEVMEYSVTVFDNSVPNSGAGVNYVSGCLDPTDASCAIRNLTNPLLHFTIESWSSGIERTQKLPNDLQPTLLTVMEYDTVDQIFIWSDVYNAGTRQNIFLDYYKFYDPALYSAFEYFDSLDTLLKILPIEYLETCTALDTKEFGNDRRKNKYIEFTQNNEVDCMNDVVWLSPACRRLANNSKCIPLIVQYEYHVVFQLSYFLNFPVALLKVRDGTPAFDDVYYRTIRSTKLMFGWYKPDDNLLGLSDKYPVLLKCPDPNTLEQSQSFFRTSLSNVKPRNYCWRYMAATDGHVAFLGSRFNFYTQDMDAMMGASALAKSRGDKVYDAMFNVACQWVQTNMDTWKHWIPAICPPGMLADPTLSFCSPCPAGSFCVGGTEGSQLCPIDSFCPAKSSSPIKCRGGYVTDGQGHTQESDCTVCSGGKVDLNGGCWSLDVVLVVILVPIFVLLLLVGQLTRFFTRSSSSAEEKKLAKMVKSLRARLHITRKEGFLLNTEKADMWADREKLVLIDKQSMESAARLAMMKREFDETFFDSFCYSLARIQDKDSTSHLFSIQYMSLCNWILELCQQLLEYNLDFSSPLKEMSNHMSGSQHALVENLDRAQHISVLLVDMNQEERYRFFEDKMPRLSIWNDDVTLFVKLKNLVAEICRKLRKVSEAQCQAILKEPGGELLLELADAEDSLKLNENAPSSDPWSSYSSSFMEGLRNVDQIPETPLRQDDARVQAIRVSEEDVKEARALFTRSCQCLPEHVFVAQLHAKATTLAETFRESLLLLLLPHSTGLVVQHAGGEEVTLRCRFEGEEDDVTVRYARVKSQHRMREKLKEFAPPAPASGPPAAAPAAAADDVDNAPPALATSPALSDVSHAARSVNVAAISRLASASFVAPACRPEAAWPLAANIVDPVRLSVVCRGPSKMLQVLQWLRAADSSEPLSVCRIRNKFVRARRKEEKGEEEEEEVQGEVDGGGLRVLMVSMLLRGPRGMNIIGEVQVHDVRTFPCYVQMQRMLKLRRSETMESYRLEQAGEAEGDKASISVAT
ncbi:hypothetical protein GUITHDRAFT_121812 [Guillardia theta CCMP2712]|uniref:Tyrosine-protein kinase ephrin type A/B receptor-like domain-containing protein n=2 Tax=Guillardia theta TaxID=55529 RepID=L1I6Y2_GUITC|nr:hypothetical protein GUITHDRAFT_121812 [Guillardia theta CCMP2712]EKX32018.1 hypothetical protein GUITHDRAFT_121812 [Guillardia theta CCMP2712]|eukprot:XP_005818998.1 hypothetical protein GUITHDRAFT_121812 [Guillardia theta CCMP2712]